MISIILSLLRLVLRSNILSILESVPCAFEKNIYSAVVGWNALDMSVRSMVFFNFSVLLLILRLDDLSIVERGALKFPTIIVVLFTFPFRSVSICFLYLGALILCAWILTVISSLWIYPFFIIYNNLWFLTTFLKSVLSDTVTPAFFFNYHFL